MTKVRIIVLDGLDYKWFSENDDVAPAFWSRMRERGCYGRLEVCHPPLTSNAAAALLCGVEVDIPWVARDHYATSQELIRCRPWIPELSRFGLSAGICNVPLTWPVAPALSPPGSWCVGGFPLDPVALRDPNRPWYLPRDLDVDGYPIRTLLDDSGPGGTDDLDALMEAECKIVDWFLCQPRKDVEVVWLRATDSAGHHAFGTEKYRTVVSHAAIEAMILMKEAENVIIVSDHGFDYLSSPRCDEYKATSHGPTAERHDLVGGHTPDGIFFAIGDAIHARGELHGLRLLDVAGGVFDLLGIPPAPGMISTGPAWSKPYADAEAERIKQQMVDLGYA